MSLPNRFPGETQFVISCGGDINDPDPLNLNLIKLFDPIRYNPTNVPYQALPFISSVRTPSQGALERFDPSPELGATCVAERSTGDPSSSICTGVIVNELNAQSTVPGNSSLMDIIGILSGINSRKRIKPQVIEKMVNGVLVREAQEKGMDWMHNFTKGIAPHASWSPMVGQLLNEVKNIETAIQNFANIPNLGALSQLPGQIMNIASMFKSMTKNQRNRAIGHMDPLLVEGLENIILLMSNANSNGTDYVSSERVNPEIFIENMITLLSQATEISDIVNVLHKLQFDKTLRGLESYAKKTDTGLTANSTIQQGESYSILILSDIVDKSRVHFDEGFSLSILNKTYLVIDSDLSSNTISVFPSVETQFTNEKVYVYEPIFEYNVQGPYGTLTMTMDVNGNVKPRKDSLQKLQQAMQALTTLVNSAEAGKDFLFGDAANQMNQLFNRIPNNNRANILQNLTQRCKSDMDPRHKKCKSTLYPKIG